jgi:RNA polymerase sigma factor (sigma-70 family)
MPNPMDWFLKHAPRLRRMLRRRGRSREDTEDVLQELFVRVMQYCREGREIRDPERFLSRTVLNLSSNLRELEHRDLYVSAPVEDLAIEDRSFAPEDNVSADQTLERLQRTLDALEPRTRAVYTMHRLKGLSYEQIADHFEISVSAIEKHIARATIALTKEMLRT